MDLVTVTLLPSPLCVFTQKILRRQTDRHVAMAMAMANSDLASRSSHSSIHTTPPLSSSSSDSSSFDTSPSHVSKSLHNLSSSIEGLISLHPTVPDTFSDVTIYASGKAVHLHRCILAARSPFFRALFSKDRRDLSYLSPSQTSTKDDLCDTVRSREDLKNGHQGDRK